MSSTRLHPNTTPWREVKLRAFHENEFCPERTHRHEELRPKAFQLTARDVDLLMFIATHRFVQARHVVEWIGADRSIAYRRLSRLTTNGLLRYERIFHAQPGVFQITHGGLSVIDSPLPKPKVDLRTYRHEIGVVWLWLAARAGAFGQADQITAEREMRHHDQASDSTVDRYAARVGGYDRAGNPKVHYPDVLVIDPDGGRIALELELSLKGERRLEQILLAYALDERIQNVIYLTDQPPVQRKLLELIDRLGVAERVVARYFPSWENAGREMNWHLIEVGGYEA